MATATPPRRRWFQFGLGTMLLLVTVFAVWLAWELKFVRARLAVFATAKNEGRPHVLFLSDYLEDGRLQLVQQGRTLDVPFWRAWMGDKPAVNILVPQRDSPTEAQRIRDLFPEAIVDHPISRRGAGGHWRAF